MNEPDDDEPEEDIDIDNYSDGGLNDGNLKHEGGGRPDLLNFNQVEKDSSIQQIKTHEDDDKFLSSGSKASVVEEVADVARSSGGVSPPRENSSRMFQEDQRGLQTALVKD